ncbi:MAG: Y-family DNA polymerase [Phycisphaerales bacterium]
MSIWMPTLATDLVRRRERRTSADGAPEDGRALLLVGQTRGAQAVAHCCDRARAGGGRPGMPAGEAQALFAPGEVRALDDDPTRTQADLERLARWAWRFAPIVAVDPPDGLFVDVTGCERVSRGERNLVRSVMRDLGRLDIASRVAIAPTFGCARALARFAPHRGSIVGAGDQRAALADLPVAALGVGFDIVDALAEVGVERLGQVMDLPRAGLASRFGDEALLRLDRALGQAIETIEPVRLAPRFVAAREFDGAATQIEAIEQAARALLGEVCAQLARHERGARRIDLELLRLDASPVRLHITLGRPTRDAKRLWSLLGRRLEGVNLGFGVERIALGATRTGRIPHEQRGMPGAGRDLDGERALAETLDAMANRLGAQRVTRIEPVESHLPERAFRLRSAMEDAPPQRARIAPAPRPTAMLDRPAPAEVMCLTPDGPVVSLRWREGEGRIVASDGPERLGDEWWRGPRDAPTRDYFRVCDEQGRWWWLLREVETGRWFLCGGWM